MNCKVYLFGELGGGYTQYPSDYTESYFKDFEHSSKSDSAVGFRREGDLVFYEYLRRLSDGKSSKGYIGIACVFNGVLFNEIKQVFALFEDAITNLVVKGEILEFTDSGEVSSKVGKLYQTDSEFKRISKYISLQVNNLGEYFVKLPSLNYSISKDASKSFSIEDDMSEIVEATRNYSKVFIFKDGSSNNALLSSYSGKLKSLNNKNCELEKVVSLQKSDIAKLERQKKQTTVVLLLVGVIAIFVLWFVSFANDKNEKIRQQSRKIDGLVTHVDKLQTDSTYLSNSLSETKTQLSNERKKNVELESVNANLSATIDEQNTTIQGLRNTIKDKDASISSLNSTITTLKKQVNNSSSNTTYSSSTSSSSSGYSSYSYSVGPYTSKSTTGYDNGYALWLYAKKALKLNSFYVKSNKSGYITIALYSAYGSVVASQQVYVTKDQFTKISTNDNFKLNGSSYYYLAISSANGISLAYHSSNSTEYSGYKSGDLQITGSDKKGSHDTSSRTKTGYYQYFYNINYSLKY